MKYQEYLYIDEADDEREIIRLFDLNQQLVVDYHGNPEVILLQDMSTGATLAEFPYGDGGDVEGYSFDVSPGHNYLIVKTVTYGQSLDDLYATLYCLKPIAPFEPRNPSEYGPLQAPYFHSYYHLTFNFSNDEAETTIWLTGQEVNNLKVIDVFQYGGREPCQSGKNAHVAQFYAEKTYPFVALGEAIRDRRTFGIPQLNEGVVVNDIAAIQRAQQQSWLSFDVKSGLLATVEALLKLNAEHDDTLLHCCYAAPAVEADVQGFNTALTQSGFDSQVIDEGTSGFIAILAVTPASEQAPLICQSVAYLSQLCKEHGIVYQNFGRANRNHWQDINWQTIVNQAFQAYVNLCELLKQDLVPVAVFCQQFYLLRKKHDKTAFDQFFNEQQQELIETVEVAVNQLQGWDIKEAELRRVTAQLLHP